MEAIVPVRDDHADWLWLRCRSLISLIEHAEIALPLELLHHIAHLTALVCAQWPVRVFADPCGAPASDCGWTTLNFALMRYPELTETLRVLCLHGDCQGHREQIFAGHRGRDAVLALTTVPRNQVVGCRYLDSQCALDRFLDGVPVDGALWIQYYTECWDEDEHDVVYMDGFEAYSLDDGIMDTVE